MSGGAGGAFGEMGKSRRLRSNYAGGHGSYGLFTWQAPGLQAMATPEVSLWSGYACRVATVSEMTTGTPPVSIPVVWAL